MAQRKSGLGKGLDALFADNSSDSGLEAIMLRVSEIEPNRNQPRRQFDQAALEELADSIREVGIIQPLIVRTIAGGGYQIVAGERRWRASQMAGLQEIPAVIRELSDREVAELALIENLQREDLNAVEEAEGYRYLVIEYGMTQEQVAERVGKSRPAVSNAVRLLELPDQVLEMVKKGSLSAGHARAILALPTEEDQVRIAGMAVRKGMTVREVEKAVKKEKEEGGARKQKVQSRDNFLDEVAISLSDVLQRRVKVSGTAERGVLEVDFFSHEELEAMANLLAGLNQWTSNN
ncbi:MAG: ParB/RepB/Spo0J family partition protein [Ruminococcaceae bacterium]|nr:ParB/RepB/Spo0J family partition protein [Oscillospiraceae bacterium]